MHKTPEQINYQKIAGLAHVVEALCSDLEISSQCLKEDSSEEPMITSDEKVKELKSTTKKMSAIVSEIQGYIDKIKNEF